MVRINMNAIIRLLNRIDKNIATSYVAIFMTFSPQAISFLLFYLGHLVWP